MAGTSSNNREPSLPSIPSQWFPSSLQLCLIGKQDSSSQTLALRLHQGVTWDLDHTTWASPPGSRWLTLELYHRASLSGFSELLVRARTAFTHPFQSTRGKKRLSSYLSLRAFPLQSGVPFRMRLPASCQTQKTKVSPQMSQLLGPSLKLSIRAFPQCSAHGTSGHSCFLLILSETSFSNSLLPCACLIPIHPIGINLVTSSRKSILIAPRLYHKLLIYIGSQHPVLTSLQHLSIYITFSLFSMREQSVSGS